MHNLIERFMAIRDRHNQRVGEMNQIKGRLSKLIVEKDRVALNQQVSKEAIILLETASQSAREFITKKFNDIVTFALQAVFGEDYRFETNLEIKRNAVWADFRVLSSGYSEAADPLMSRGGGVVDIVSMALRIVLIELYTPRIDGPIIFDEPTKQLSKMFSGRTSELLQAISERVHRQIILVTHDPVLAKDATSKVEL